jgi:hypothetical protein
MATTRVIQLARPGSSVVNVSVTGWRGTNTSPVIVTAVRQAANAVVHGLLRPEADG